MAQVVAYHRPEDLGEAIGLLAEPNRAALAGGTVLNADHQPPAVEVVDLQALGLDGIEHDGTRLRIGATVTLDRLADHESTPAWLADLASAELPSTLRTLATIGGTIAAGGGESVLLAGLLAAGAEVQIEGQTDGGSSPGPMPLADVLATGLGPGALITSVTIDPTVSASVATTARTPADVPIVAAVAATEAGGVTRLALTGVAATPILVDPADPTVALGRHQGIDPPADFRGSPDYRRHLAATLAARAIGAQS